MTRTGCKHMYAYILLFLSKLLVNGSQNCLGTPMPQQSPYWYAFGPGVIDSADTNRIPCSTIALGLYTAGQTPRMP